MWTFVKFMDIRRLLVREFNERGLRASVEEMINDIDKKHGSFGFGVVRENVAEAMNS